MEGVESKQGIMRMEDWDGVHCGLEYFTPEMVKKQIKRLTPGGSEFVLISKYDDTPTRRRGPDGVESHIPYFDETVYPFMGPDSGLVNCLVVQWNGHIAERMSVAQIHIKTLNAVQSTRKHVWLV
jgi:hypothetical protein